MKPLVRSCLAVGSVVVAAWFGLGWIQARDAGRAQTLVTASKLSPAEARQARSLLRSAGTLNPDRFVDILRAKLASDQGLHERAVSILQSVTRAEPSNLEAWSELVLATAAAGHTARAEQDFRHVHSLLGNPR